MPAVEPFIKRLGVTRLQTFLDPLGRIAKRDGGNAPTPFVLGACRFPTSSTVTGGSLTILPARSNGRGGPFSITMPTAKTTELEQLGSLRGVRACVFDAYGTLFDFGSTAKQCRDALGDHIERLTKLWRNTRRAGTAC